MQKWFNPMTFAYVILLRRKRKQR